MKSHGYIKQLGQKEIQFLIFKKMSHDRNIFTTNFELKIITMQENGIYITDEILMETFIKVKNDSKLSEDKRKTYQIWIKNWHETLHRLNPTIIWKSNSPEF